MFKPEKLVRITIQVPYQLTFAATAALAHFKLLHLIRIRETRLGGPGSAAESEGGLLDELDALFQETKNLLKGLQIGPEPLALKAPVTPEKEVFKIRERISMIRAEVDPDLGDLQNTEQTLLEIKTQQNKFDFLPADLDLSLLWGCQSVKWMIGLVPLKGVDKLEESASEIRHVFIHIGLIEQRSLMLVFALRSDWHVFERALRGAFFEKMDISDGFQGTVREVMEKLQSQIAGLEEKKVHLSVQREMFKNKFASELLMLKEKIIASRNILLARRFFGKLDSSNLISGWVPERLYAALKEELVKATQGQVIIEKVDPEDLIEVREGIIRIPILFNNPILISPFEKLTSLYGTPCYREIEPTIFLALSFLLLFGMMFGDVGHGGFLFGLGYLIFRRFYKYMDYGIILMECGIFSVLFGVLYGSFFGMESILPALWFRPLANIVYFVKMALVFGIALVSLGLVLNIINAFRLKEYEGLLSAGGLAGALFYWLLVGLGLKHFFSGRLVSDELTVFGWVAAVLITAMVFHRPLYRLLTKKEHFRELIRRKGLFTEIIESSIEFFDDLMRHLAHTISFIRIAAFALAHAALFTAVFSIADLMAHIPGGGIWYWLVMVAGNLVIILLEGLVVSIQAVRLEYYEFFSKFFRGGGEGFRSFDREIGSMERRP